MELEASTQNGNIKVQCEDYSAKLVYKTPSEARVAEAKIKYPWLFKDDKTPTKVQK